MQTVRQFFRLMLIWGFSLPQFFDFVFFRNFPHYASFLRINSSHHGDLPLSFLRFSVIKRFSALLGAFGVSGNVRC